MVLVSILVYLWYLSILGASDPYSILSILIIICTFLLLRCQLLKLYGSLSSRVIMPFPLIFRMLIYMFPLLSIIASFYILFGIMCLISGGFYLLDLPQPLGFSHPSLNPFYSFAITKVCILSSIWMISWSLFALSGQVKGHACFLCSLLVRLGLHFNFSKSDLCLSQSFTFLGLCWDTVHMSVSLPPDKLADIQQLALSLLHTPHVTVHKVMSFLGKANFCINGHSQLQRLCRVIQSDMLSVYHSPTHLFSHVHFSPSSLHQLDRLANLQQSPVPLQFPLPDVVIGTDATPTRWAFYFQGSGLPLSVSGTWSGSLSRAHIALQELQAVAVMLCRMAFCLSGKVVALHLDNSTAKAYLYNQGGTVSPFLSRLACHILSLTEKHGITLLPAYIPTHLNVEAYFLSRDSACFQSGTFYLKWLRQLFAFGAFQRWTCLHLLVLLNASYYITLETPLPLGALG